MLFGESARGVVQLCACACSTRLRRIISSERVFVSGEVRTQTTNATGKRGKSHDGGGGTFEIFHRVRLNVYKSMLLLVHRHIIAQTRTAFLSV